MGIKSVNRQQVGVGHSHVNKSILDLTEKSYSNVDYSLVQTIEGFISNVKHPDFGAVGDGITDDTSAIQACIDYVISQGGGTVFIPAGIYLISDTLRVNESNIKIKGSGGGGLEGHYSRPMLPKISGNYIQQGNTLLIWSGVDDGIVFQVASEIIANPVGAPDLYRREKDLHAVHIHDLEIWGWDHRQEPIPSSNSSAPVPSQPIASIVLDLIAVTNGSFKNLTLVYARHCCLHLQASSPAWKDDGQGGFEYDWDIVTAGNLALNNFSHIQAYNQIANVDTTSEEIYPFGRALMLTREGTFGGNCHNNNFEYVSCTSFYKPSIEIDSADDNYYDHVGTNSWLAYGMIIHGIADASGNTAGFYPFGVVGERFNCYNGGTILLCGTDTDNPSYPGTSYILPCTGISFTMFDTQNSQLYPQVGAEVTWSLDESGSGYQQTPAPNYLDGKVIHSNLALGTRLNALHSGIGGKEQIVGYKGTGSFYLNSSWRSERKKYYDVFRLQFSGVALTEFGLTDQKELAISGCTNPLNDGTYSVWRPDIWHVGTYAYMYGSIIGDDTATTIEVHPQMDWNGWNHGIMELDSESWMNPVKFIDAVGCQAGTLIIKQNATGTGVWPGWETATSNKLVWLNNNEPDPSTLLINEGIIISIIYTSTIDKYICQTSQIIDLS